jgi:hypothetical protein
MMIVDCLLQNKQWEPEVCPADNSVTEGDGYHASNESGGNEVMIGPCACAYPLLAYQGCHSPSCICLTLMWDLC